MSDLKNLGVPITLDSERNLIFSLNVLEKCIDRYKNMDNILNGAFENVSEIKWLAVQMLNEDAEIWNEEHDERKPLLTEDKVGRYVAGMGGIVELQNKVREAMFKGLPQDKVKEVEEMAEEVGKNLIATQGQKLNRTQRRQQQKK
ncbi:MAG TPA: hypothetical protein VN549_02625 [Negativicutes bacterium]|nr:hypothetical protein [Negativicutes bacterium]